MKSNSRISKVIQCCRSNSLTYGGTNARKCQNRNDISQYKK